MVSTFAAIIFLSSFFLFLRTLFRRPKPCLLFLFPPDCPRNPSSAPHSCPFFFYFFPSSSDGKESRPGWLCARMMQDAPHSKADQPDIFLRTLMELKNVTHDPLCPFVSLFPLPYKDISPVPGKDGFVLINLQSKEGEPIRFSPLLSY